MPLLLRSVLPDSHPAKVLTTLPRCTNVLCPKPPSLWQRWWARHEGTWLEDGWYCSPDCFFDGLCQRLDDLGAPKHLAAKPNRLPLGLVMLSQRQITAAQLRRALEMQRCTQSGRIGEWLVKTGAVSEDQVTSALALQQGCPVFSLRELQPLPTTMHWPRPLTEVYHAVPVFYSPAQSTLYIGFLEAVDHAFLYAVQQMLRCRPEPCILPPVAFRQNLGRCDPSRASETIVIQQRQNAVEMAQAIGNYAQQVRAGHCILTLCATHLWIRLLCFSGFHVDFLFRSPAAS